MKRVGIRGLFSNSDFYRPCFCKYFSCSYVSPLNLLGKEIQLLKTKAQVMNLGSWERTHATPKKREEGKPSIIYSFLLHRASTRSSLTGRCYLLHRSSLGGWAFHQPTHHLYLYLSLCSVCHLSAWTGWRICTLGSLNTGTHLFLFVLDGPWKCRCCGWNLSHLSVSRCKHYRRRCKIRAPCCNQVFACRHCHNEIMVKSWRPPCVFLFSSFIWPCGGALGSLMLALNFDEIGVFCWSKIWVLIRCSLLVSCCICRIIGAVVIPMSFPGATLRP